jgi:O-antigen/teichoic acid export membrane protein
MLRFGLPFIPGGLGYALTERVNIFFLERMPADRVLELYGSGMPSATVEAVQAGNADAATSFVVGTYGGILKLAILMTLAVQMFRYAWQPFFLNHAKDRDAPELFARVFLVLTAGLLAVLLIVSFFARELVGIPLPGGRTLIAPAYWIGLSIIPIALSGYFFQGWYYHFSAGAYIKNLTRYFVPCTLVGAAAAVVLNATLVNRFGMEAAAAATAASYAVMAIMLFGMIRKAYPVSYPWGSSLLLMASAWGALAVWQFNPSLQTWWVELLAVLAFGGLSVELVRRAGNLPLTGAPD